MSSCIVLLPPGGHETQTPDEIRCSWQMGPGDTPVEGTLAGAVADARSAGLAVELVLSAADAVISSVLLNRRQARHLRRVVPYLLEENLLDPPEKMWFSAGKGRAGQYPVLACRQELLERLVVFLRDSNVELEGVRVDAELLRDQAPLRLRYPQTCESLLVFSQHHLVVPDDQVEQLARAAGVDIASADEAGELSLVFDSFRNALDRAVGLNLLHSELKPARKGRGTFEGWRQGWKPLAQTAAVVIVLVWTMLVIQQWRYQQAADQAREQAVALYQDLFPGDRVTAVTRQFEARINELRRGTGSGSGFLDLLGPLGEALAGAPREGVEIRRIHYEERDGVIQLDVGAGDFDRLQEIRQRIQGEGLSAEITEGRSRDERVTARIRVGRQA